MGCSASSDKWCKRSDCAFAGILGVHKLMYGILIEAKDYNELCEKIGQVLQKCVDTNFTISLKKMQSEKQFFLQDTRFPVMESTLLKKEFLQSNIFLHRVTLKKSKVFLAY